MKNGKAEPLSKVYVVDILYIFLYTRREERKVQNMLIKSATNVRKEWSQTCDEVVRVRPSFIKRTRDMLFLSSAETLSELLSDHVFSATIIREEDGSFTALSNEMDLAENAPSKEAAKLALGRSILDYAEEFYNEYDLYLRAPNRKQHLPYVLKALLISDPKKITESIVCRQQAN